MINFMLLAFQGFLETFGVCAFMMRMCANTCITCCSCVNMTSIMIAACYRYNLRGRLAALSTASSIDSSTYEQDAQIISQVLLAQITGCTLYYLIMS